MKEGRLKRRLAAWAAVIFCLAAMLTGAQAESAEIRIPVIATSADCTAALLDEGGNAVQTLELTAGEERFFTVTSDRLGTTAYTVKLTNENTATTTYDPSVFAVNAMLYYSGSGALATLVEIKPYGDVSSPKKERVEFENVFTPLPVTLDPPVRKIVTGNPPKAETFTFVMTAGSNTAGLSQMPMPKGITGSRATVQTTGAEQKEFGTMTFAEPGIYVYNIKEEAGAAKGYSYDTTEYTLTIEVTRQGDELVLTHNIADASGAAVEEMAFTNAFTPDPATLEIPVKKTVTGTTSSTEKFTFTLAAGTKKPEGVEAMPMPGSATVQITGTGSAKFGEIAYTQPGTYEYTVRETKGSATGYTYDETVYTVTVTVVQDGDHYKATPAYAVNGSARTEISFTNTYRSSGGGDPQPEPTTVTISGEKVWVDDHNANGARPESITVQLLANGAVKDTQTVTGSGDTWSFSFANLPETDESGMIIDYTVQETPVEYYTSSVSGTTITNTLEPREPEKTTRVEGTKTWNDNNNADGKRPDSVEIWLIRDGERVDSRTALAANGWRYAFEDLPADNGYGHEYVYTVREVAVEGYFQRVDGYNLINTRLPETPTTPTGGTTDYTPSRPGTPPPPFKDKTEEELEELTELFDYETPLWGGLLQTGDETPVWPYVFGGVGAAAAVGAIALFAVGKRRKKGK